MRWTGLLGAWLAVAFAGCGLIAGLDEDFVVGDTTTGTASTPAGTSPTGTSPTGTSPTGTSPTGTAGAGGGQGAAGGQAGAGGRAGAGGAGGAVDPCGQGFVCLSDLASGSYAFVTSEQLSSCPTGFMSPEKIGDGSQPGCAACSCGGPIGGTCTPASLYGYHDSSCGSYAGSITASEAPPGACYDFTGSAASWRLAASTPSASTCPSTVGQPAVLDTSTACSLAQPPSISCGAGRSCIATGEDGPAGDLCALLPSGSLCPPHLPVAQSVQVFVGDSRSCQCGCQPSTGQYCTGGAVTLYTNTSCTAASNTISADGQCHAASDSATALRRAASTWTGGSCASVSAESGQISWGTAYTLCCP